MPAPSTLMVQAFLGLAISLVYGLLGAAAIYLIFGHADAQQFLTTFIADYGMLVSLGTITSTALIVRQAQGVIPSTIEAAFKRHELEATAYFDQKERFYSKRRTVQFATEMIILGFAIFWVCRFRLNPAGETLMMIAVCAQYALASYVGRKLRYAAMMLHSLLRISVKRNLFRTRALDDINAAVHIASTLTIVWVYVHVRTSYGAPFAYDTFIGKSAQMFLLIPAVLAVPVLLMFNFFPRTALKKIYSKSIDVELRHVRALLRNESISSHEKRLFLMEFGKMCREELRHSLQLTLSDLPLAMYLFTDPGCERWVSDCAGFARRRIWHRANAVCRF